MSVHADRRRHQRFLLPSMYTEVEVKPLDCESFQWSGHAYDISEGGMRFELDQPIQPGMTVGMRIRLPGDSRSGDDRPVYVLANVVWLEEEDIEIAGPVRMACVFKQFVVPGEEGRLRARLTRGRYAAAA